MRLRTVPEVDRPADGPDGAGAPLDPDDDVVAAPVLGDPVEDALGEPHDGPVLGHGTRIQSPS
jgi:hypothetical protein